MCGTAIARYGISRDDFYKLSPKEFDEVQICWFESWKSSMEDMRLQTFYLVNVHLGKNGYKSLEQMMPFDWDKTSRGVYVDWDKPSKVCNWSEADWSKYDK